MINLPNGCKCSEIAASPSNWNTPKAPMNCTWYLQYRSYDPNYAANAKCKNGKQVIIKAGINRLKTLKERQEMIAALIAAEKLKGIGATMPISYNMHT